MSDLTLADLSLEDRRALPYNHPLLDAYAAQIEEANGLPAGMLRALKNAGEKSASGSTSPKGAKGVMQFMPRTAKEIGLDDPTDPLASIEAAGRHTAKLQSQVGGDPSLIAAAYNAGPNRQAIRNGQIPKIPETQQYVARVNDYLQNQSKMPKIDGMSLDDLNPEDYHALMKAQGIDPTNGMSWGEKVLAGAGKSVHDNVLGVKQFGADLANKVSQTIAGRNIVDQATVDEMRNQAAEDNRLDNALMKTGAGLTGYFGGQVLQTAIPATAITKAAPVVGLANQAAKVAPILGRAVPMAASGAGVSAIAPVTKDGERATNMAIGAVTGPVLNELGNVAGKGIKYAADETGVTGVVNKAVDALPEIPGLIKRSWNKTMTTPEREAVGTAMANDVPVYGSQLKVPGSDLHGSRTSNQSEALDRAISRTFGEDTSDLATAFRNSSDRHAATYSALLDSKTIPLDKSHIADLVAIGRYNAARSPRFAPSPELQDSVDRAIQAAQQNSTISGRDFQDILRGYKASMQQELKGTATKPSDHYTAQGYSQLIDAVTKQAEKVMKPEELALFRQTNKEYRNRMMLEALAPKDLNGSINPKQLANALSRKDKANFLYGKGGNKELSNLARYGATYMGLDATAPSGFVKRGKDFAKSAAPMLAGDLAGAAVMGNAMGDHEKDGFDLGTMAKYGALGLGVHGALSAVRSGMNPRLTAADLDAPRGALGEWFSRSHMPAAATLTLENRD